MVVLVLALISAIGVFSMRSAGITDLASGFNRQSVQSAIMAEYGARAAASYIDTNKNIIFSTAQIAGCSPRLQAAKADTACIPLLPSLLVDNFNATAPVALVDGLSGRLSLDGDPTAIEAEFATELMDAAVANAQLQVGSQGGDKVYSVTFTSIAKVYPTDGSNAGACSPGSGQALSQQSVRAHVTVNLN
jgi:hypothetical protein